MELIITLKLGSNSIEKKFIDERNSIKSNILLYSFEVKFAQNATEGPLVISVELDKSRVLIK
jgi:hypothetical protein